jgi:hypothetical protein
VTFCHRTLIAPPIWARRLRHGLAVSTLGLSFAGYGKEIFASLPLTAILPLPSECRDI